MPGKNSLKYLPFILLAFVFWGCGHRSKEPVELAFPKDSVIDREQMIRILVDLQLMEAGLQLQKNSGIRNEGVEVIYYNGLCRKFHISRKRFKENLEYYQQDKEDFYMMYEDVVNRLGELKEPGKKPGKK